MSTDPRPKITMNTDTLKINEYEKKRTGRPRNAWWIFAIQNVWKWIETLNTEDKHTTGTLFNPDNPAHQEEIKKHADEHIEAKTNSRPTKTKTNKHPSINSSRDNY